MITIPGTLEEVKAFEWGTFEEELERLSKPDLTEDTFEQWMDEVNDAHWVPFTAHVILTWHSRNDTTDEDVAKHLAKFYKEIYPSLEPKLSKLSKKAVNARVASRKYDQAFDEIKAEHQISNSESAKLEAEDAAAKNTLNKSFSALTISINGEEVSYREARAKLKTELNSEARRHIWEATQEARSSFVEERFEQIKDIIRIRRSIAESAGAKSYRDFVWASNKRDFSADQTLQFATTAEEVFRNLADEVMQNRAEKLGISKVRPWDVDVGINEKSNSDSVLDAKRYQEIAVKVFNEIDDELASIVKGIAENGNFDLMTRQRKAQNNYASYIYPGNKPLVFTNAVGHVSDLSTILHECGHCCHYSLSHIAKNDYWTFLGRTDLNETIARFVENIGILTLSELGVLDTSSLEIYRNQQIFTLLNTLRMIGNRDIFQHWVYDQALEDLTLENFDEFYLKNNRKYEVDWSGWEKHLARGWSDITNFTHPFRTIEYSMAGIAYILLLKQYTEDRKESLITLKEVMRKGKRISLKGMMNAFDLPHPLEEKALEMTHEYLDSNRLR